MLSVGVIVILRKVVPKKSAASDTEVPQTLDTARL